LRPWRWSRTAASYVESPSYEVSSAAITCSTPSACHAHPVCTTKREPKRWRSYSIPRRSRAGHAVRIAVIKRWRNDMPDQTQEQNSSQPTSQGVSATTEGQPIEGQPTEGQPTEGQPEDATAALHQIGDTTADTIKKPTTLAAIAGGAVVASAVTFGVLETAVGGAAAYFAYRMLRRRRSEATAQGASRTG
jgi:hypothetical protein